MSKKILCLSGWGQKFDSLEFIFKKSAFDPIFFDQVTSLDYSSYLDVEQFFSEVAARNLNPDILVGWSLGGQLSLRLIEKKIIAPKLLILIAPPFQMVKSEKIMAAMTQNTFAEFRANLIKAPSQTMKQFSILMAMNDRHASEIARSLDINDKNFAGLIYWLDELKRFSCFDLDFSQMPRTLFFQGAGDMIVHSSQSEYFKERIANFRLEIFKNCGHAPQLSDVDLMRQIIAQEAAKI